MKYSNTKFVIIILLLLNEQTASCCINEYRVSLDRQVRVTDARSNATPVGHFQHLNKTYLTNQLHSADSIYKLTGKLEDYSDYAVMLLYNKEFLKAKSIFQNIEVESPGLYATAANLGTAYELLGNNDSAYYWINKSIEINPQAHEGSEWIHLKILEAKLYARGDEQYLSTHNILSLDFGNKEIPKFHSGNAKLDSIRSQLYYQLEERMTFIQPKDAVVGQLLFDLGNATALTMDATAALQVYEASAKYGYNSEILHKRIAYYKPTQRKADIKNAIADFKHEHVVLILVMVFLFIAATPFLIAFLIRKRKRNTTLSSSAQNKDDLDSQ